MNFEELFGSDSDADGGDDTQFYEHDAVKGLYVWKKAISERLQGEILQNLSNAYLLDPAVGRNQAMGFGALPPFVNPLINLSTRLLPTHLSRTPAFDQMIVNHYHPGDGIKPHLDLDKFEDGVIIASFLSSLVMEFRRCDEDEGAGYDLKPMHGLKPSVGVLLEPGDIVCLCGDARYKWTHCIAYRLEDLWTDKEGNDHVLQRGERISITLRRLVPDP